MVLEGAETGDVLAVDGHAAQGDGEFNGDALATSMNFSFKATTGSLLTLLQAGYHLSLTEASQIIGPAVEYRIPKVAATKVEVVAMLPKAAIAHLQWQNQ